MDALGRMDAESFKQAEKMPLVVVLDNVRSMHNVGSVFRSSDAFLVEAIYLCGFTPCPPHRDIHKTALGSTDTVTWKYVDETMNAIQLLKDEGYTIVSVEQVTNSVSLPAVQWDGQSKIAVVMGNEVDGVDQEIINESSYCIEIPQMGTKHSLNISVATGIVLYKMAEFYISSK
ncbi:RNA methyltransferase [Chitinophagaceae bacterium LY-5]|uniref:RNA methyltransferase n=2 Tax=Polluticaenibacter yanchengensis TaxID=3014562 RepID=A0ABT4UKC0_9BACT|nr:RNA methyltransferase [Chitinophagaceae bacterium LY-5]